MNKWKFIDLIRVTSTRMLATAMLCTSALLSIGLTLHSASIEGLGGWHWIIAMALAGAGTLLRLIPASWRIERLLLLSRKGDRMETNAMNVIAARAQMTLADVSNEFQIKRQLSPNVQAALDVELQKLGIRLLHIDYWFGLFLSAVVFSSMLVEVSGRIMDKLPRPLAAGQKSSGPPALDESGDPHAIAMAILPFPPGEITVSSDDTVLVTPRDPTNPSSSLNKNVAESIQGLTKEFTIMQGAVDKYSEGLADAQADAAKLEQLGKDKADILKQCDTLSKEIAEMKAVAAANGNTDAKAALDEMETQVNTTKNLINSTNPNAPTGQRKPQSFDSDWKQIKEALEKILNVLKEAWELIQKFMEFFKEISAGTSGSSGNQSPGQQSPGQQSPGQQSPSQGGSTNRTSNASNSSDSGSKPRITLVPTVGSSRIGNGGRIGDPSTPGEAASTKNAPATPSSGSDDSDKN